VLRAWFEQWLLDRGRIIQNTTRNKEIESLIRMMVPVSTDVPLIRVGGDGDGGYLIPNDLDGIRYCFSPGVSSTCTFESDLVVRGIESFMADYSVPGPPSTSAMFHFEKRFLGACDDDIFTRLGTWIERNVPNDSGDLILQMDIEGSEYDVIFDTPETIWRRFRILVIEFHWLHSVFEPMGFRMIALCLKKLLTAFEVVHIHPNNCCGVRSRAGLEVPTLAEITFLRKDRIGERRPAGEFPHPLDRPNIRGKPDLVLPKCFRGD